MRLALSFLLLVVMFGCGRTPMGIGNTSDAPRGGTAGSWTGANGTASDGTQGGGSGGASTGGTVVVGKGALVVDKSSIDLGTLLQRVTAVATITLTNVGNAATGTLVVTASAGMTAVGCSDSLSAGASCTITIAVAPTSEGDFSGTVSLGAEPGAVPPLLVSVVAKVLDSAEVFLVSPASIDLGDVTVGVSAPKLIITVTTAIPLIDMGWRADGPDVTIDKAASTCTSVLAAGASCVLVIDFLATTSGAKDDSVTVAAGGQWSPTFRIPITANAQKPA